MTAATPFPDGATDESALAALQRVRFEENWGRVFLFLRERPPFAALPRVPWHLFLGTAFHWYLDIDVWPSQEDIAAFSGYSPRAVRKHIVAVEKRWMVRRRKRWLDGTRRVYYAPGPVTVRELAAFAERFPQLCASPDAHSAEARGADPGASEGVAPHDGSVPLVDAAPGWNPGTLSPVTDEDRQIARAALAECFVRRNPGYAPPLLFDDRDVERVATCVAAVDGDRPAKLLAQRDAIDAAFRASRRAPTVRFIWGKLEHFFDHVAEGRRVRIAEARRASGPELSEDAHGAVADTANQSLTQEQMSADLARLFGPSWKGL